MPQTLLDYLHAGMLADSSEVAVYISQSHDQPSDLRLHVILCGVHLGGNSQLHDYTAAQPHLKAVALLAGGELSTFTSCDGPERWLQLACETWDAFVESPAADQRIRAGACRFWSKFDAAKARKYASAVVQESLQQHRSTLASVPSQGRVLSALENEIRSLGVRSHNAFVARRHAEARELSLHRLERVRELIEDRHGVGQDATHGANDILGCIALDDGDVEAACAHLKAAFGVVSSPALQNFGPRVVLAKMLCERGHHGIVMECLHAFARVWRNGRELTKWLSALERQETPDFGANLNFIR